MRQLYDKDTHIFIGAVSDDEFQLLMDQLEEETAEDTDYYLNRATLDLLEEAGANAHLLAILRRAMGERDEMEIYWTHEA